jgi:hypothetical protein
MVLSFYFWSMENEPSAVRHLSLSFGSVTMLSTFGDAAKISCADVLYGCGLVGARGATVPGHIGHRYIRSTERCRCLF